MPGKPWTIQEEQMLKQLIETGQPLHVIASKLSKSQESVQMKCIRLGLRVDEHKGLGSTTREIEFPKELPSIEEALAKSMRREIRHCEVEGVALLLQAKMKYAGFLKQLMSKKQFKIYFDSDIIAGLTVEQFKQVPGKAPEGDTEGYIIFSHPRAPKMIPFGQSVCLVGQVS